MVLACVGTLGALGGVTNDGDDEIRAVSEGRKVAHSDSGATRLLLLDRKMARDAVVATRPATDVQAVPESDSLSAPSIAVAEEPAATAAPEPVVDVPYADILCAFAWNCETAARIVRCESMFRPDAVGAGSYGLFQIQASVHAHKFADFWEAWMNPWRNAEYAWVVYVSRGYSWAAWSCA